MAVFGFPSLGIDIRISISVSALNLMGRYSVA